MVNTYPDLFWGYSVIWAILVAYLLLLGRRVTRIEAAIREREKR